MFLRLLGLKLEGILAVVALRGVIELIKYPGIEREPVFCLLFAVMCLHMIASVLLMVHWIHEHRRFEVPESRIEESHVLGCVTSRWHECAIDVAYIPRLRNYAVKWDDAHG